MNRKVYTGAILIAFLLFSSPAFAAFSITEISPKEINDPNSVVTLHASGSGLTNSKAEYLQAAITKEGEASNYFGFTQNLSDSWVKYKSSPDESTRATFYTFTPTDGSWSGEVKFKIDATDSGFKGSGNYNVKLLRYITSSSSNDSNTVTLKINYNNPTPTPTVTPAATPTPTKSTPTTTPVKDKLIPTPTKAITPTIGTIKKVSPTLAVTPEVLGISTEEVKISSESDYIIDLSTHSAAVNVVQEVATPSLAPNAKETNFSKIQIYWLTGIFLVLVIGAIGVGKYLKK